MAYKFCSDNSEAKPEGYAFASFFYLHGDAEIDTDLIWHNCDTEAVPDGKHSIADCFSAEEFTMVVWLVANIKYGLVYLSYDVQAERYAEDLVELGKAP